MIRTVLIDFDTSVGTRGGRPRPDVRTALETILGFVDHGGEPVSVVLLSEGSRGNIGGLGRLLWGWVRDTRRGPKTAQDRFEAWLVRMGLAGTTGAAGGSVRPLAAGSAEHLTDPEFLRRAARLGGDSGPGQCVFLTGDRRRVAPGRALGMQVLVHEPTGSGGDFADWSEAPLAVARVMESLSALDPASDPNTMAALRCHFAAEDLELIELGPPDDHGVCQGRMRVWHRLDDLRLGVLDGVNVRVLADVELRLDHRGLVQGVEIREPTPEVVREAVLYVRGLEANQQVAAESGDLPLGATHQLEHGRDGRRFLRRRRHFAS